MTWKVFFTSVEEKLWWHKKFHWMNSFNEIKFFQEKWKQLFYLILKLNFEQTNCSRVSVSSKRRLLLGQFTENKPVPMFIFSKALGCNFTAFLKTELPQRYSLNP